MAFTYEIKHGFAGFEKHLYLPYADILEMPISFDRIPCPAQSQAQETNHRHLFQPAQALYDILIVGILERHIILKYRTVTIAEFV